MNILYMFPVYFYTTVLVNFLFEMNFKPWHLLSNGTEENSQNTLHISKRYSNQNGSHFEDIFFHDDRYEFEWPIGNENRSWIYGSYEPNDMDTIHRHIRSASNFRHLLIFDWDDTLFFTAYLHYKFNFDADKMNNTHNFTPQMVGYINKIGQLLFELFTKLIHFYGAENIKIITSADPDWSSSCMNTCGPIITNAYSKFNRLIKAHSIQIISARTEYQQKCRNVSYFDDSDDERTCDEFSFENASIGCNDSYNEEDSSKWKKFTFDSVIKKHFGFDIDRQTTESYCIQNIGDSFAEYEASRTASDFMNISNHSHRCLLRIKLLDEPDLCDFYKQLLSVDRIMMERIDMFSKGDDQIGHSLRLLKMMKQRNNEMLQIKARMKTFVSILVISTLISLFLFVCRNS